MESRDLIKQDGTPLISKNDGSFAAINKGLGDVNRDAIADLYIPRPTNYSRLFLEDCFTNLWVVRRACSLLPKLAWKKGGRLTLGGKNSNFELIGQIGKILSGNRVATKHQPLGLRVKEYFKQAQITANIHRGAGLIMLIDDGNIDNFEVPVNVNNIKGVRGLRLFDGWDLQPWFQGWADGNLEGEYYYLGGNRILDHTGKKLAANFLVHHSRVLPFYGPKLTEYQGDLVANGWAGDTLIRQILEATAQYLASHQAVAAALQSFEVTNLEIKGLYKRATKEKNYNVGLRDRADSLMKLYSMFRILITDMEEEKVTQIGQKFQGIKENLEAFSDHLCAAVGLPRSLIFGQYGSSLGHLGEHEQSAISELISEVQTDCFQDNLETLLTYIFLSQESPTKGQIPDEWGWEWYNNRELTAKEIAELRKRDAETIEIYINCGVISAEEARNSVFGGKEYGGTNIVLAEKIEADF